MLGLDHPEYKSAHILCMQSNLFSHRQLITITFIFLWFYLQGIVVFIIDGEKWTLDLRPSKGTLTKGDPEEKADIQLTMNDATFVGLVMGKIGSQQAFLMRKLKINGSMGLAMKLQPILDAAAPKAKM